MKRWAPLAVAVALWTPLCFDEIRDADTGFHIAVGRLLRERGVFGLHENALSWTAPHHRWEPTSWLYDRVLAGLTDTLGPLGVQLLTAFFALAALVALWHACEGSWVLVPVALLLAPRLQPRPHVATWAVLAAALALCQRRRWALAVAAIILGNQLHAGALFAAFVVGVFALVERRWLIALLAPLALLVHPGGLYEVRSVLFHADVPYPVVEFVRPSLSRDALFFLLAPLAVALGVRARKPALALIATGFALAGFIAVRMTFEFFLVAAPIFALAAAELPRSLRTAVLGALCFAAVAVARLDVRYEVASLHPAFDEEQLPVRAAKFVAQAGLDGPHFNTFDDGGYLEYALPRLPAFVDGRLEAYPAELWRALAAAPASAQSFDAFLRRTGCEWAIIQRPRSETQHTFLDPRGWALVYWDDADEVFLRRDVPRLAAAIDRFEYRHFRPDGAVLREIAAATDLAPIDAEIARFRLSSPADPWAALAACELSVRRGKPECADALRLARTDQQRELVGLALQVPKL